MEELAALNARIVHQLDHRMAADRLPADMTPEAWAAIRPNLAKVEDAADWWRIIQGPIESDAEPGDRPFLEAAAAVAETVGWGDSPWNALVAALKERTGRSGKPLFRDSGPEMAVLLPLIGKDQSIARLRAAAAS
jgi:glutamyl-tRNA synthetase